MEEKKMQKNEYTEYTEILRKTEQSAATDLMYDGYMSGAAYFQTPQEADVAVTAAVIDGMVQSLGDAAQEALGAYEEASRRAGFYAGFRAAVAYYRFMRLTGLLR